MTKDARRRTGSFAVATVLSVAAYHLSVFGVLFLIPLQWVYHRLGVRSFLYASLLSGLGIAAVDVAIKAAFKSPWSAVDTAALGLPVLLLAGWAAIVLLENLNWRFLYRLLAVTGAAGLVLFVVVGWLLSQPAFVQMAAGAFESLWNQVVSASGLAVSADSPLDEKALFELLKQAFLGSVVVVFFLLWGFTDQVSRAFKPDARPRPLRGFRVPTPVTWALLAVWALILGQGVLVRVGVKWDWGFAQYAVLNVAWVTVAVHLLAGLGIVSALLERWKLPRLARTAVWVLLALMVLQGVGQLVLVIGLTLLAVLELWVNFRNRTEGVEQ